MTIFILFFTLLGHCDAKAFCTTDVKDVINCIGGILKKKLCENLMIFLSLRFYVKSVLEDLEVVKLYFIILGALKIILVNFT